MSEVKINYEELCKQLNVEMANMQERILDLQIMIEITNDRYVELLNKNANLELQLRKAQRQ